MAGGVDGRVALPWKGRPVRLSKQTPLSAIVRCNSAGKLIASSGAAMDPQQLALQPSGTYLSAKDRALPLGRRSFVGENIKNNAQVLSSK